MQIILLDKIYNLGKIGSQIQVKSGYARNFLIPQGKATLATKKNIQNMQKKIESLNESLNLNLKQNEERAKKINDIKQINIFAKIGKKEKLFGSIGKRNISDEVTKVSGVVIKKNEVILKKGSLRTSGKHLVNFKLHHQIYAKIIVNIISATKKNSKEKLS